MIKKILFIFCFSLFASNAVAMEKKATATISTELAQAADEAALGVKAVLSSLKKIDDETRGTVLVNILTTDAQEKQRSRAFENTRRVLGAAFRTGSKATRVGTILGGVFGTIAGLIPAMLYKNPKLILKTAAIGAVGLGALHLFGGPIVGAYKEVNAIRNNNDFKRISQNYFTLNHIAWLFKRHEDSDIDFRDKKAAIKLSDGTKARLESQREKINDAHLKDIAFKKMDFRATDRNGWNVLHHAAFAGDEKTVQHLLKIQNLRLETKCRAGGLQFTAVELARNAGNMRIANMIDAEVNKRLLDNAVHLVNKAVLDCIHQNQS